MSIAAAATSSLTSPGSGDDHVGGDHPPGGVGPDRAETIADTVALGEIDDFGTDRVDDAGRLEPEAARQREWIEPGAVIGVDEVDPDRGVADADLAASGVADGDRFVGEHVGPPGGGEANGEIGHGGLQLGVLAIKR